MLRAAFLLAGCLLTSVSTAQDPNDDGKALAQTAADRVVLRDGQVVLGLVTSASAGPRVGFEMLVRRDWAEKHLETLAAKWERSAESAAKPAITQRRERLREWRRERAVAVPQGDRILAWIDEELKRLDDEKALAPTPLLSVRIPRNDARSVERQPRANGRLLALGWLCNMTDVEDKPIAELQDALEGRGFAINDTETPSLDRLLPIASEPDARWLARRAATEVAVDPDLRFVRYQSLLLPDSPLGQPVPGAGLDAASALSQITKLLDPDAQQADPLVPALAKIAAQGRVGAAVTQLEVAPDLSRVVVEIALWVRGPRGWTVFGARSHSIRPEEVDPAVGQNIAGDPQVQAAFGIVEKLGLGAIAPELKERSLKIGAATSQALGAARSAFNQELDALALPVLEERRDPTPAPRNAEADKPAAPQPPK